MKRMRKGFTLVELLIVIAIIGVLAASMSLSASDATPKAEIARLTSDFKLLKNAVALYHFDHSTAGDASLENFLTTASPDYLAGKLKDYKIEADATNSSKWTATYIKGLSVAAAAAFTDSADLMISPADPEGRGASMRIR